MCAIHHTNRFICLFSCLFLWGFFFFFFSFFLFSHATFVLSEFQRISFVFCFLLIFYRLFCFKVYLSYNTPPPPLLPFICFVYHLFFFLSVYQSTHPLVWLSTLNLAALGVGYVAPHWISARVAQVLRVNA